MAQETYFKKLMESPKIARHLIENYLLPDGKFDIYTVLQDKKLQVTFEIIEKDLLFLIEQKFAVCRIQIENISGDIILVFLAHPDFIEVLLNDKSLQNKSVRPHSFDKKKIDAEAEKINYLNRELLYEYLKSEGIDLISLTRINDKTFNSFLNNKPFLQYYGNSDTAFEIGQKYGARYDIKYFRKMLVKKKSELFVHEKMRLVKEHLYTFFETTYYARISQIGTILEGLENRATELDIKHLIYTSPKDFLIVGIRSMRTSPVSEYNKYRAYIKDGIIEVLKGNQLYPLENILKYDALAFELLSPLYLYKAHLTYPANIQHIEKKIEDKIYIIRKNKISTIVTDLLRKGTFLENERDYASLLLFYTVMVDYSKSPSKIMILKTTGKADTNYYLGFSSTEELKEVIKKIEKILVLRARVEIHNKHLFFIKQKKGNSFFSLILHTIFSGKTEAGVIKKLDTIKNEARTLSDKILTSIQEKAAGTRTEVAALIIRTIKDKNLKASDLEKLKTKIKNDPGQLLQYTTPAVKAFVNDLLKNDTDGRFADEIISLL